MHLSALDISSSSGCLDTAACFTQAFRLPRLAWGTLVVRSNPWTHRQHLGLYFQNAGGLVVHAFSSPTKRLVY